MTRFRSGSAFRPFPLVARSRCVQWRGRRPCKSIRTKGGDMASKIFVNLPVKNLNRSIEFFTKLGFSFNQQFTDETATCMIVSPEACVMLLTEEKFHSFTPNPICDA